MQISSLSGQVGDLVIIRCMCVVVLIYYEVLGDPCDHKTHSSLVSCDLLFMLKFVATESIVCMV